MCGGKGSNSGGFTLIELLVVLALVFIVEALAAPAMSKVTGSIRVSTNTNLLLTGLMLARSEAIKRNSRVVVCQSANGEACATTGGWHGGWIVFHDPNNNARLDSGEQVLLREQVSGTGLRISGNSPVASYVSYTGMGVTRMTSGAFQAGTFTSCMQSDRPTDGIELVISNSGRARTKRLKLDACH